jgi:hypothetical protein
MWLEWARFCQEKLGWEFNEFRHVVARRVQMLDVITFAETTEGGGAS